MQQLDDANPNLVIGLQAAVPLLILELAHMDPGRRDQTRIWWAADAAAEVGSKGDALQFGGRPGEAAKVFAALARGLAAAAYQPGGITAFGQHWCANAGRDAGQPEPKPTSSVPTFRGRPVETVHPSEVL